MADKWGFRALDVDVALKQLENDGSVITGPQKPYENDPNSTMMVIGMFSAREFICLTEKGYVAARD
jgi:hypothetical protein